MATPMTYPNRLRECMERADISAPTLAKAADTTRQTIYKLQRGDMRLSREWAERLGKHLNVSWPELMGFIPPERKESERHRRIIRAIGSRIAWVRSQYNVSAQRVADLLEVSLRRFTAIEAGEQEPTVLEVIAFSTRFRVSCDFILCGITDDLPRAMLVELKLSRPDLLPLQARMDGDRDTGQE